MEVCTPSGRVMLVKARRVERGIADGDHPVGKGDTGQAVARTECKITVNRSLSGKGDARSNCGGAKAASPMVTPVGEGDAGRAVAAERRITNHGDSLRDIHQLAASSPARISKSAFFRFVKQPRCLPRPAWDDRSAAGLQFAASKDSRPMGSAASGGDAVSAAG